MKKQTITLVIMFSILMLIMVGCNSGGGSSSLDPVTDNNTETPPVVEDPPIIKDPPIVEDLPIEEEPPVENPVEEPDSDNDGIPDNLDQCPGADDTVDINMNDIPDCCDGHLFEVVSGIIEEDTVWSKDRIIDGKVTVVYGAMLTIESGVRVFGSQDVYVYGTDASRPTGSLEIQGVLNVKGNRPFTAQFCNVHIYGATKESKETTFQIFIKGADIIHGSLLTQTNNARGSLYLKESILLNPSHMNQEEDFWLNTYLHLSHPFQDCIIHDNQFINWCPLVLGTSNGKTITITNNVFHTDEGIEYSISPTIVNFSSYSTSPILVHFNSFLDLDRIAVALLEGYPAYNVNAVNNYWDTLDVPNIEGRIFDLGDTYKCKAVIPYQPFLVQPHPNTSDTIFLPKYMGYSIP